MSNCRYAGKNNRLQLTWQSIFYYHMVFTIKDTWGTSEKSPMKNKYFRIDPNPPFPNYYLWKQPRQLSIYQRRVQIFGGFQNAKPSFLKLFWSCFAKKLSNINYLRNFIKKCYIQQRRVQNPAKHLKWSILQTVNSFQLLLIFSKSSILDVGLGCEYTSILCFLL